MAAAAKAPDDAAAQYRAALACSYFAEVTTELHDRNRPAALPNRGSRPPERAVTLKSDNADLPILGTLYGQAITDMIERPRLWPQGPRRGR